MISYNSDRIIVTNLDSQIGVPDVITLQGNSTSLSSKSSLSSRLRVSKKDVALSFGGASSGYDAAADLQRVVASHLLGLLTARAQVKQPGNYSGAPIHPCFDSLLDLGSGTGFMLPMLHEALEPAHLVALDIAEGMVRFSDSQHANNASLNHLCADAESLPLASGSIDGVFSSFALQWCPQLSIALEEVCRVLKPGGHFGLCVPGPGTLIELQKSWQRVDSDTHVNTFPDQSMLMQNLSELGFVDLHFHRQLITLNYANLSDLMRELKAIGAHNLNQQRNKGLLGKNKLSKLIDAYEQFRGASGLLPASYQIIYALATKPELKN